jgi:hypothetical protein
MSFTVRNGHRKPPEPSTAQFAHAHPMLCRDIPHWWWPLTASDAKLSGVRSICLRCGQHDMRRPVKPLGVLAVNVTVRPLGR